MLVGKNIMNIQVPAGNTISVPAAAAAAALDSTTTEPSSTKPTSSTEPPSTEPPLKEQQAVSAAVAMNHLEETVDPKDYPTLNSKNMICLQTDKDITPVLQDIMKLSKEVRSVVLLKVLNYDDITTSPVKAPCSAKQSRWIHEASPAVSRMDSSNFAMRSKVQRGRVSC
jgi:hypothetical protein